MKNLETRVTFLEPKRGDIIKDMKVIAKEYIKNQEVYIYEPSLPNSKGIIFPNDNLVFLEHSYDVIINRVSKKHNGYILLSEIYYSREDLIQKRIPIKISGISKSNKPMFRLHDYRGFVEYGKAEIGDKLVVKVLKILPGNIIENFLQTEIISHIK